MAERGSNWHEDVFFGIHYDLHAVADDTALGRDLTPEHLRERLALVRPDWIQCDCKGHPGYTSWPTTVGSTSPGMVNDALRIHRDVTRELGIRLGMHYSGIWDKRAIALHPDWACMDEKGQPSPNYTCRLSGYADELMIPQLIEIADNYDVDGFWVDGDNWAAQPCWCERCKAEFNRRTGITAVPTQAGQEHWDRWLAFHRDVFVEYVTRYTNAVHARKPKCLVCSNWMYTVRQPEPVKAPVDYISGDYDHAWGANRAAVEGRLIEGRGMTWDLMVWGFTKTGNMGDDPPWCPKTVTHLCQEVSEVLALGGAIMVYDQPQRSGWISGWRQQTIAEVANFCRSRKDICFKTRSIPQAAVLHWADHYYAHNDPLYCYGRSIQPLEGALHALLETHHSTDILTADSARARMGEYKLIVVPEQTRLSQDLVERLEDYARGGGQVLMTGSHLVQECSELIGIGKEARELINICLPVGDKAVRMSGTWSAVTPAARTQALVFALAHDDPRKEASKDAVVTRRTVGRGAVTAIHGPVFRDYFLGHYPLLRTFLAELLDGMGISWLAAMKAPARLEMVLRRRDDRVMVNLINRGAGETLSPQRVIVEELSPVLDAELKVRWEGKPREVTAVPTDLPMTWSYADGWITVKIPRIDIHCVIAVH